MENGFSYELAMYSFNKKLLLFILCYNVYRQLDIQFAFLKGFVVCCSRQTKPIIPQIASSSMS